MKQIRRNTFETNSSSTHSMVIGTEDEIEKWRNGEAYLNNVWSNDVKDRLGKYAHEQFIPSDVVLELFAADYERDGKGWYDEFAYYARSELDLVAYKYFYDDLEQDVNSYTSPSGDKLKIICAYGYD